MNAEIAINSVQSACPQKRTMSRSEADEMLGREKIPLGLTFSNQRLKAIGIYASQIIGQGINLAAN
jgi:hypothetical protein